MMENPQCLICGSLIFEGESSWNEQENWSSVNQLSRKLQIYFLQKRILNLPESKLLDYIQSGEDFKINVCDSCTVNYLNTCVKIYKELVRAQKRFDEARKRVVEIVKHSVEEDVNGIRKEIKEFLKNHDHDGPLVDYTEGDLLAIKKLSKPQVDIKFNLFDASSVAVKEEADYDNDNDFGDVDNWTNRSNSPPPSPPVKKAPRRPYVIQSRSSKRFSCPDCDFKASNYHSVWNHKKRVHTSDLSSFTCQVCNKVYSRSYDVRQHMAVVHTGKGNKPKCHLCDKEYLEFSSLREHLTSEHEIKSNNRKKYTGKDDKTRNTSKSPVSSTTTKSPKKPYVLKSQSSKTFQCTDCDFKASNYVSVWNHKKREHAVDPSALTCKLCKRVFSRSYRLRQHMSLAHNGKQKIRKCQLCPKEYTDLAALREHLASEHNIQRRCRVKRTATKKDIKVGVSKSPSKSTTAKGLKKPYVIQSPSSKLFSCTECDFKATNYHSVWNHKKRVHTSDLSSFTCTVCNKVYSRSFCLRQHMALVHTGQLEKPTCHLCGKDYVELPSLKEHLASVHSIKKFCRHKCTVEGCTRSYWSIGGLEKHLLHGHNPKLPSLKPPSKMSLRPTCPECGKPCKNQASLDLHRKTHLPLAERRYECQHCDKVFKSRNGLQLHVQLSHPSSPDKIKSFQCNHCGRIYSHKNSLSTHIDRIHTKKAQSTCESCGVSFITDLRMREHQVEIHHTCRTLNCREKFDNRDDLWNHQMETHGDEIYLWKCNQCEKIFSKRPRLAKHLKIHEIRSRKAGDIGTGTEYVCEMCGKSFPMRDYLVYHVWHTHKQGRKKKVKQEPI